MIDAAAARVVDTRGMRCPWPALRLARAARADGGGVQYLVLADDPQAAREIVALAAARQWRCVTELERFHVFT